ncbi:MAG: Gfo/Idh/MocA family oxidoreductase [Rhodospirillales bacterium]
MTQKSPPLLLVGAGMYVTGRGAAGYRGTIAPAVLEACRAGQIGRLALASTRAETARDAVTAIEALGRDMGVETACAAYPAKDSDPQAFLKAAEETGAEAAIIAVPDHLHAEVTIPLLERGIHCLVVKPMADTFENAKKMCDAARKANVVAEVEFHKRLDEANLLMRESLRAGQLGTPLYATIEYSQRKTVPRDIFKTWAARTNIFQYLGVHYVDLLQWATGFKPVRVTAWGQKNHLAALGLDTWDAMQVVIEWDTGKGSKFVSTHITNWIDPDTSSAMSDQKITVVGTEGRYDSDQKHRGVQLVTDKNGLQDINPYFTAAWHDGPDDALHFDGYGIRSVRRFIDDVIAVRNGHVTLADLEKSRPTFSACLAAAAVVDAAKCSLENASQPTVVST